MAIFKISYKSDDSGRTRKIGEAPSRKEAFELRDKKAAGIIKRWGCDPEDEAAAKAEVIGSKDMWAEWNGNHFIIEKVA